LGTVQNHLKITLWASLKPQNPKTPKPQNPFYLKIQYTNFET
jgi:hypothetical protein